MGEITSKAVALIATIIVVGAALVLVFTFPVMWLWNWLMPDIFGLQTITFLQAMGLVALSSLLFRSGSGSSSK